MLNDPLNLDGLRRFALCAVHYAVKIDPGAVVQFDFPLCFSDRRAVLLGYFPNAGLDLFNDFSV